MPRPNVSVIIPVYNAEGFLDRCMRSVLAQTLHNIEIICVDDGSTDGSGPLLDRYAQQDSRITVIHQPNAGAGAARNAGLAIAQGTYLSFLDADDIFEPTMLETAFTKAKADRLDIIIFRSDQCDPQTGQCEPTDWTIHRHLLPAFPDVLPFANFHIHYDIFMAFVGWTWDKLFKTSFIQKIGLRFQELRTTNDMYFTFCAIARAQRMGIVEDVLVHHMKEAGSLSVTREKSWGCFYEALCAVRDQLRAWGLFEWRQQDFINYSLHATLWNVNTLAEPTKTLLKQRLKDEWYEDLGIAAHNEDYFYNKGEYADYLAILNESDMADTDDQQPAAQERS